MLPIYDAAVPLVVLLVDSSPARLDEACRTLAGAGHAVVRAAAASQIECSPDVVVVAGDLTTAERDAIQARVGADVPVWTTSEDLVRRLAERECGSRSLLQLTACVVDLRMRTAYRDGAAIGLTEKEAALLSWLAARPNQSVSQESLLEHVWGYRRDTQTRTVGATAFRLRAKIEADPSKPDHVLTVRGEGFRFVPGKSASPVVQEVTQPVSVEVSTGDAVPELLGRAAELQELDAMARGAPGVVTVLGPPGIGKTTLVKTWCPGPFIELAAARSEADISAAVSEALDVPADAIPNALGPLVAFDNAEQVAEPLGRLLEEWLAGSPETTAVLTSRIRLGLAAERVLEVGPLGEADAIELLLMRARERRPGFAQTERDRVHVAALVATLERVPLAIELAAARARLMSPRDLADRLRRDLGALHDPSRPGRHASVEGACRWSWDLLGPAAQTALAALSVFRGGFTAGAAEAMEVDLDVLEQLIDHSLVHVAGTAGDELRFDLLDTIRRFAEAQLTDDGARHLHARWMESWTSQAELAARQSYDGLAALGRERANITAAVRFLLDRDPERAARVLLSTRPRWFLHYTPSDHTELLEALWERLEDGAAKASVGYHYGAALTRYGLVERSLPIARESVEIARRIDDPNTLTEALLGLDFAHQIAGDPEAAAARLREVPPGIEPHLRIAVLVSWSTLYRRFDDPNRSEALLREALGIARTHGLEPFRVGIEGHLGAILFIASREAESIALCEAALEVHRANDNIREMVQIGTNLASAYRTSGDPERGLRAIEEVVELAGKRGLPMEIARAEMHLSRAQLHTGSPELALATARQSVGVSRALGSASDWVFGHVDVANALLDLGQSDQALAEAERALEGAQSTASPRVVVMVLLCLARAHLDRGDAGEAVRACERALEYDNDDGSALDRIGLNGMLALVRVLAGQDGRPAAARARALAERGENDRSRGVLPALATAIAAVAAGEDGRIAFERAREAARANPGLVWSPTVEVYGLAFDPDPASLEAALASRNARLRQAARTVRRLLG